VAQRSDLDLEFLGEIASPVRAAQIGGTNNTIPRNRDFEKVSALEIIGFAG
jgi:hypothetical protein